MAKQSRGRRATRADVAREAGTSVAVVSYVINNGPRPVADATRQRVLTAVKKIGYRPNSIARALASGATKTFGLVVPNISNLFIASLAHALQQEVLARGQVMLLGDSGDSRQRELELINNLLDHQVDGLIYTSVDRHPSLDVILASGTPLVLLDRLEPGDYGISVLRVDERAAARHVCAHLLSHGYQNAAIISGPLEMMNAQDRLNGWRDALTAYQLSVNEAWIFPASYTREGGYQATQRMLASGVLPQALFASNELQAIGCVRALSEVGLSVPGDVALVCFNGTEQSAYQVPALTGVRQPVAEMARKAFEMLQNWTGEPELVEFAHRLEIGESCGCRLQVAASAGKTTSSRNEKSDN